MGGSLEMSENYLTPNDLRDTDPNTCWNPECSHYSEKAPHCCTEHLRDGECDERYQMSTYGKVMADAGYTKGYVKGYQGGESERGTLRDKVTILRQALEAAYDELQRLEFGGCDCHICRQTREALAISEVRSRPFTLKDAGHAD
jgi:hypothetical protein